MARSALKCEKNEQIQKEKLKQAMKKGNIEGARIYAEVVELKYFHFEGLLKYLECYSRKKSST